AQCWSNSDLRDDDQDDHRAHDAEQQSIHLGPRQRCSFLAASLATIAAQPKIIDFIKSKKRQTSMSKWVSSEQVIELPNLVPDINRRICSLLVAERVPQFCRRATHSAPTK